MPSVVVVLALFALLFATAEAAASQRVARNATRVVLKVDAKNRAVVYYTRGGIRQKVAAWGAVNARPSSAYPIKQVRFQLDYTGGNARLGFPLWKTIRNACQPYDGPPVVLFVTGCKAPDGSYWVIQRWKKRLPAFGYPGWLAEHFAYDLHLSHFTGELPVLELYSDWAYSSRLHHVFGRLTYRGLPVHGYTYTRYGSPLDSYGRTVTLDTYNSRYGPGWKRENAFVTHKYGGNFCYTFARRRSYYDSSYRGPGNGQRYRMTVMGPGVTPIVRAYAPGLPAYNPLNPDHVAHEQAMNALGDQLAARDANYCHQH